MTAKRSVPAPSRTATAATSVPKDPVPVSASATSRDTAEVADLKKALEESAKQVTELRLDMNGLEKERDFYFDKLREIELIVQDLEDNGKASEVTAAIIKILYATADGFTQATAADAEESAHEEAAAAAAATEGETPDEEAETF